MSSSLIFTFAETRQIFQICAIGVVYSIPFPCRLVNIGQTPAPSDVVCKLETEGARKFPLGHCALDALGHALPRLRVHCRFFDNKSSFPPQLPADREIFEAHRIQNAGQNCVSESSIGLHDKEIFLDYHH